MAECGRHHGRVHALLDAAFGHQRDAQQLDAVAEVVGGLDVRLRDALDALDVDLVEGDAGAEGEARQQGELVGGVEAADVEGGIGLGVALRLRFLEDIGEGAMLFQHLRQDVVAGAVEDAVDAADLVGGQRFAHGLDDRDAAGDRRLEVERDAVLLGQPRQLGAVLGQQRLVGGDDVLAGAQRGLDGGFGRAVVAADQLDEDVDGRIGREPVGGSNQAMPSRLTPRSLSRLRALTPVTTISRPTVSARRAPCVCNRRSRPAPTVPSPATPNLNGWLICLQSNVTPFAELGSRYAWFPATARGTS